MAYSPIEQGRMLNHPVLESIAARHGARSAQVGLAWLLQQDGLVVIPKAGIPEHVRENRASLDLRLAKRDLSDLDRAFPPPTEKRSLDIL
jgi:diketogulonate reductase-like aldo/keto reductase